MERISFIIMVFTRLFLNGQNLIQNGDFEFYTSCPTLSSQLPLATPWTAAPNNSVEYFNSCNNSYLNVPNQSFNYQLARSGQAFIGCWFLNGNNSYREYPQIQLTQTLVNNNYYYIIFYVNRNAHCYYAINNIAGSFQSVNTTTTSATTNSNVLSYYSDIVKFGNPIIKDTINWEKIEGIYKANGNENYFLIGNFNYDSQTDTINEHGGSYPGAYYFIDDVSVENITTPQWQYRDTTVTLGDSVLIGPAITGLNVDWFTMGNAFIKNDPGIYVKPLTTTKYKATETFNSVVYNHTVTVTVLPPNSLDEYEKLQTSIIIFPNPGVNTFNLATFDLTEGEIQVNITDVTGKQVSSNTLNVVNALTLFHLDAKSGIYFVKITNNDKIIIKKLIVQQ